MEDIQLIGVPYSSVDEVWQKVQPLLQKGIDYGDGELDVKDILKFLLDRAMQLWVLYNYTEDVIVMASVTEIIHYPQRKYCRFVTLGGERVDDWMSYIADIELWAKSQGCDSMEAYGRRGLAKKLEQVGYTNQYVVIRKPL